MQRLPRAPKGFPPGLRERYWLLRRTANSLAAFYGLPVYLVGSALRRGNRDPRDIDIRIEMPDRVFDARYGDPKKWNDEGVTGEYTPIRWRWSADCVKRTRQAWRETGLNIDFQVYPVSHCKILYRGKPKLRIDTRPARLPRKRRAA